MSCFYMDCYYLGPELVWFGVNDLLVFLGNPVCLHLLPSSLIE